MKCPVCKENVNELNDTCPNCKTNFDEYEEHAKKHEKEVKSTNADRLNIMANISIAMSIIGAIAMLFCFSTIEITRKSTYGSGYYTDTVINWWGIIGAFSMIFVGFMIFFLLKTIVDIYDKVNG